MDKWLQTMVTSSGSGHSRDMNMKKLLSCCIFAGLMLIGTVPGMAAGTVGQQCVTAKFKLVDGQYKLIDCSQYKYDFAAVCSVYCNDGTLLYGIKKCNDGYYTFEPYNDPKDLYKQCLTMADACGKTSGASWEGTYCDCKNNRYEWKWNTGTGQCEETDEYKACSAKTSKALWDENRGRCLCLEQDYEWNGQKCVLLPSKAECETLQNDTKSKLHNKVRWDSLQKKCICVKDSAGNAITNPDEWDINPWRDACVKKQSVLRAEWFEKNRYAADEKRKSIKDIISQLNEMSENMGRSHWKNADGNFNVARLASDSVAGVVLGTIGGVVTSNIIKKNQVKGGFEDINCVVGGQRVAGFADQFQVGVQ